MKMSLICLFGIAVFVGFGEGIDWIIVPTVAAGVLAGGLLLLGRLSNGIPVLHGHGDTRRRAKNHERRHKKVYRGVGGKGGYYEIKEKADGFHGDFYPGRNWKKLPAEAQAAVYAAGALGPSSEGAGCYADDLAAVDGLGVSRSTATRIASKHLGWW